MKNFQAMIVASLSIATLVVCSTTAMAADKPNILMIMGDDIGYWNIGAYHRGMMAGETPHIDQLAAEGAIFTDAYAEALKDMGYVTGQFGKNHLGDRNEFLPTVHGFDEFFGYNADKS